MSDMKKLTAIVAVAVIFLTGCFEKEVKPLELKSSDTNIMEYKIDFENDDSDDLKPSIEKNFIIHKHNDLILAVTQDCKEDKQRDIALSIDGISCKSNVEDLKKLQKESSEINQCSGFESNNYRLITNKNAIYKVEMETGSIISLGLSNKRSNLYYRHGYQVSACFLWEKNMRDANENGFKSIAAHRKYKQNRLEVAGTDDNWYNLPPDFQFTNKCERFDLKDFIAGLVSLGWNHSIFEASKELDIPVEVHVSINQPGERIGVIYTFLGEARCNTALRKKKSELNNASQLIEKNLQKQLNRY